MLKRILRRFERKPDESEQPFEVPDVSMQPAAPEPAERDEAPADDAPAPERIDSLAIFCSPGVYQAMKFWIAHSRTAAIILLPEFGWNPRWIEEFCRKENCPAERVVPIEEAYFARYLSPMRDGYAQGPVLPPMPVVDKLRIRLYPPNAERICQALNKALALHEGDECTVTIYTDPLSHCGFFVDAALLAGHVLAAREGLKARIRLFIAKSYDGNLPYAWMNTYRRATMEEAERLMQADLPPEERLITVGGVETTLHPGLIDACTVLRDDGEMGLADALRLLRAEQTPDGMYPGWPYFNECDWSDISYRDFEPEEEVVLKIKEYARAARDMGLHLYEEGSEHWRI